MNSFKAILMCLFFMGAACGTVTENVYMGNGIKIGEVSQNSAIIWTRLTKTPEPNNPGIKFSDFEPGEFIKDTTLSAQQMGPDGGFTSQLPAGVKLAQAEGAVPGISGEVRLTYMEMGTENTKQVVDWQPVDPERDFTRQFHLDGLQPATQYSVVVDGRKHSSGPATATLDGSFSTAADKEQSRKVTFTVVTGTRYDSRDAGMQGHHFYTSMSKLKPTFFVHTGDIVYYDHVDPYVTHIDLARFSWNRMFGLPNTRDFLKHVPAYFMKDDHDSWDNDCWPSMPGEMGLFTYEQGVRVFDEQVPVSDRRHYRTFRWGKDLQIWLVEVRDYRSPNHDPDGPDKTMWGKTQIFWFKDTVERSDATFKILLSPTPIVGPDHLWKATKTDNHADKGWSYEGDMLRNFISSQKNMYFICGDRHWQYISKHEKTGMLEYCSGPSTDAHATTIENPDRAMHLYYRPEGGFLAVTIDRIDEVPTAVFRHYNVLGELQNEDIRVAVK
jgi:alkaline phosphatase D